MLPSRTGNALLLALLQLPCFRASTQIPIINHDSAEHTSTWNLNYTSAAPHYFASVYGLLQQWPNIYFPNGHSIVPCEVTAFTKLYHGRVDEQVPPSPEWVAFDIAMSYGIMGSGRNSHMLTYQTTRPFKCVYFDGASAALMGTGQLHTQMLHVYGNTSGPPRSGAPRRALQGEYARARGLCNWLEEEKLGGLGWGYEGIVRMNVGFEMIVCNFSSPSIQFLSRLNVTAPLLPPFDARKNNSDPIDDIESVPGPSPRDPFSVSSIPYGPITELLREPFLLGQLHDWFVSGTLRYGSSGAGPGRGETHVQLSTCGFLSYYDPVFASQAVPGAIGEQKSLNLTSNGLWKGPGHNGTRAQGLEMLSRRRRLQTLVNISTSDAALMRAKSERVLRAGLEPHISNCSGVDWYALTNEIVEIYAQPIYKLLKTLKLYEDPQTVNKTSVKDWLAQTRVQTHAFLMPFLEYPEIFNDEAVWDRDAPLFQEASSRCRHQHTQLLHPDNGIFLGPEESRLKWAVEETQAEICTVLLDISFAIESTWLSKYNELPLPDPGPHHEPAAVPAGAVQRWTAGVEELMAWLGWGGEWTRCDQCAWDESCYIPMWPLIHWTPPPTKGGNESWDPWGDVERDLWQPKCVKAADFMGHAIGDV